MGTQRPRRILLIGFYRYLRVLSYKYCAMPAKKHREDRQYHYAVATWRIKSSQLLFQKFLVALVHFLEISLARNGQMKRAKAASVRAFRVFAAYRRSSSSGLAAPWHKLG